jgi:hypothetical protein
VHFIVESEEQLARLKQKTGRCFIHLIPGSDNYHPLLTSPSLLYIRPVSDQKGYIVVLDHSEGISVRNIDLNQLLCNFSEIYCLDGKTHAYFIDLPLYDINYWLLENREKPRETKGDTLLIRELYNRVGTVYKSVNRVVPIGKIYEYWEGVYSSLIPSLDKIQDWDYTFYREYEEVYREVERQGLKIDTSFIPETKTEYPDYFIEGEKVYTRYNLYNSTCRPTNSFNGVNFLALEKESPARRSIIPALDCFLEFDFDAYHLRLIADLIGFKFPSSETEIHRYLGKYYFGKENLTEEEYAIAKQVTFKNIYGGIEKEYLTIPFYLAIDQYQKSLGGRQSLKLPTGKTLHDPKLENPLIGFNYLVQNLETKTNVRILKKIQNLLTNFESKLVLVVYDSFLLDFSFADGSNLIKPMVRLLAEEGYPVKIKYGSNYADLKKR